MRLFLAIPLSALVKDALIDVQNHMYGRGVRGRFTPEDNLHLTLCFIGEYPDAGPVLDALSNVAFEPFELSLEGLGSFGDLWWAGLRSSAPLEALVRRIRRSLAENQIPFDRKRFSPHITLIRKASGNMAGIRVRQETMLVNKFSLMRSDQGKNGMLYTEIGSKEANAL